MAARAGQSAGTLAPLRGSTASGTSSTGYKEQKSLAQGVRPFGRDWNRDAKSNARADYVGEKAR